MKALRAVGFLLALFGGLSLLKFLLPGLWCFGTENDAQCRLVAVLFSGIHDLVTGLLLIALGGALSWASRPDRRRKLPVIVGAGILLAVANFWAWPRIEYDLAGRACRQSSTVETVMSEGETISATIAGQTMDIVAGPCYERTFRWSGGECTIRQHPRGERWYGSLGIHSPSALDWKPWGCLALKHSVVEEGQLHFSSVTEAQDWIKGKQDPSLRAANAHKISKPMLRAYEAVYNRNGLVVWFSPENLERSTLTAAVWQVYISGAKPVQLEGAQDAMLKITR